MKKFKKYYPYAAIVLSIVLTVVILVMNDSEVELMPSYVYRIITVLILGLITHGGYSFMKEKRL